MLTKDEMTELDAQMCKIIFAKQELIGLSDRKLGKQAFGFLGTPHMKMQSIKGGGGKAPQQLRFADIYNLCEALGLDWYREVCLPAVRAVEAMQNTKKSEASEG